jgi:hypothetical protein
MCCIRSIILSAAHGTPDASPTTRSKLCRAERPRTVKFCRFLPACPSTRSVRIDDDVVPAVDAVDPDLEVSPLLLSHTTQRADNEPCHETPGRRRGGQVVRTPWAVAGAFSGRIVAAGNITEWRGLPADVGVLTEGRQRGRGLAGRLVGTMVADVLPSVGIVRYRALASNIASLSVARRLGFEPNGQN